MQAKIESYEDLGRYLRDVRESVKITLKTAAQDLNIRAKYLSALEEGNLSELPGKIYARGYLSHYAEYLGLDKNEVMEAYDRLSSPDHKTRYFVPEPTSHSFQPSMLAIVGSVLVLLLIYGYWYASDDAVPEEISDGIPPVPEHLLMGGGMSGQPVILMDEAAMEVPTVEDTGESSPSTMEAEQTPSDAEALPWLRQGNAP